MSPGPRERHPVAREPRRAAPRPQRSRRGADRERAGGALERVRSSVGRSVDPRGAAVARRRRDRADHRRITARRAGCSSTGDLEVALLLAAQASLAIDNATLDAAAAGRRERSLRRERVPQAQGAEDQVRHIIGESPAMKSVIRRSSTGDRYARATVCIGGETGTGERADRRRHPPSVAARRQDVRRAELPAPRCSRTSSSRSCFGAKRGGVHQRRTATRRACSEIADAARCSSTRWRDAMTLQAKLLRVLQEGTIPPRRRDRREAGRCPESSVRPTRSRRRGREGSLPPGSLLRLMVFPIKLPPQLRERPRGHPAALRALPQAPRRGVSRRAARVHPGRARCALRVQLAGQHPRARERDSSAS